MMQPGHHITPMESGSGYTLTTPLRPLAALQNDFSLVSGMRIPYNVDSDAPEDVPAGGAFRDFHGGGAGPCGQRQRIAARVCDDRALTRARPYGRYMSFMRSVR